MKPCFMSHPQACKRVEGLWVRTKTEEHTVELKQSQNTLQ